MPTMASERPPSAHPPPSGPLRPGQVFGPLLLMEDLQPPAPAPRIRQFLAWDRDLLQEVMVTALAVPENATDRFFAECEVTRQIESEALPGLLDAAAHGKVLALTHSWEPYLNLKQVLAGGGLHRDQALRVLWRLADALQALHGRGMVHGNLRPENICFTRSGELRLLGVIPSPANLLVHDQKSDYPMRRYTPPEWSQSRSLLPTGDIFALGLVTLELFTGRPVFPRCTAEEITALQSKLAENIKKAGLFDRVPSQLHKVLKRMLEFDRNVRPVTAMNLIPNLERALSGTSFQEPLPAALAERLRMPRRELALAVLEGAEQALADGAIMVAVSRLRQYIRLAPAARSGDQRRASEALIGCLWRSYDEDQDPRTTEALAYQALRITERLQRQGLSVLAKIRLSQVVPEDSPLYPKVARNLDPKLRKKKFEQALNQLKKRPTCSESLLALAILERPPPRPPHTTIPLYKASLCLQAGVSRSGLILASEALGDDASYAGALELFPPMLAEVLGEPAPKAPATTLRRAPSVRPKKLPARPAEPASLEPGSIAPDGPDGAAFLSAPRAEADPGSPLPDSPPAFEITPKAAPSQGHPSDLVAPSPAEDPSGLSHTPELAAAPTLEDPPEIAEAPEHENPKAPDQIQYDEADELRRFIDNDDMGEFSFTPPLEMPLSSAPPPAPSASPPLTPPLETDIPWGEQSIEGGFESLPPTNDLAVPPDRFEPTDNLEPAPPRPPTSAGGPTTEADNQCARLEKLLSDDNLEKAAQVLMSIPDSDGFRKDVHYSRLCAGIRGFLWKAILPWPEKMRKHEVLEGVLAIAQGIGFDAVVGTGERLLIQCLPEKGRTEHLETLLTVSPHSIPILQAASRSAAKSGDNEAWIRHLTAAGQTFLEVGELALASKMFMALRSLDPESEAATQGLKGLFELGEKTVEADRAWAQVKTALGNAEDAREALDFCLPFLARFPHHQAACENAAAYYEHVGDQTEAARLYLLLALRELYREEESTARKLLRAVVRNDFGNEEALMLLAILEPPSFDAPREVWRLKVSLLEREGLFGAAIFHARKRLRGKPVDFPILALLAGLCRKAGQDPSPHLVAQGNISWRRGDEELARDCFVAALEESFDRDALTAELLSREGIQDIIPPEILLAR